MSSSYVLTPSKLQVRNTRNVDSEEFVEFESINPLAQALRDYIVSGPGLIPGVCAAGLAMQARAHADTHSSSTFYYTLQEAVLALKAARPGSLSLTRTVITLSRLVSSLVASGQTPTECCAAFDRLHNIICNRIALDEALISRTILETLPKEGAVAAVGGFGSLHSVSHGTLVPAVIGLKNAGKTAPKVYCPTALPLTETFCTVRELKAAGCEAQLVSDAGLATLLLRKPIGAVYLMAVRICANGDILTPAGATGLAAAAKQVGIPVYAVSYCHVFDAGYASASDAPVEEYEPQPETDPVFQPYVSVVPREWLTGYITSTGVVRSGDPGVLKPLMDTADSVHTVTVEALAPAC